MNLQQATDNSVNESMLEDRFSIRRMMLCVFAVAVGLVIGRTHPFTFVEGCFAAASVLVIARLLDEIRFFRKQSTLTRHSNRFHSRWRYLLIGCICVFFALPFVQSRSAWLDALRHFRETDRGMFTTWADAPLMLLLLSFYCFVAMNVPNRSGSVKKRDGLVLNGVIAVSTWGVVLALAMQFTPVVALVQFALEGMEYSANGAIVGESSQYSATSWGLYAGVDPDSHRRTAKFIRTSTMASIPLMLLFPAFYWAIATLNSGSTRRGIAVCALWFVIAMMAIYPAWLYSTGLRQFCPAYAEVGLDAYTSSLFTGGLGLVLLSMFLARRFVAPIATAKPEDGLPRIDTLTLTMLVLANVAWGFAYFRNIDFLRSCYSEGLLATTGQLLTVPTIYLWLAVLSVVGKELCCRLFFRRATAALEIEEVETRKVLTIFFAVLMSLACAGPTILWLAYSLSLALLQR